MTKPKTLDYDNVKSLDTENKFLNPIWMWVQNNTKQYPYNDSKNLCQSQIDRKTDRDYKSSAKRTYKLENKIDDIF